MSVFAALLSIVLFVTFALTGSQKIVFNPIMSKAAEHLGFTKRGYQRIGVLEIVGALGILIGVVASRSSFLGLVNELAATGLVVMMILAVRVHIRRADRVTLFTPALILGSLALVELIVRLG
jgi:uncharacterized membrane protein YphA (DoxX/SURF4 family)